MKLYSGGGGEGGQHLPPPVPFWVLSPTSCLLLTNFGHDWGPFSVQQQIRRNFVTIL